MLPANCIVKCVAGSKAYGTDILGSDSDFRGVYVGSPKQIRTPFFNCPSITDPNEEDTSYWELSAFVLMLTGGKPTSHEVLWASPQLYVHKSPAFDVIKQSADRFLSQKILHSLTGFAKAEQKKLIKNYNAKNAALVIRLFNIATEVATDQGFIVTRPNANMLKDVRMNVISQEDALDLIEEAKCAAAIAERKCALPAAVDTEFAASIIMKVQDIIWMK